VQQDWHISYTYVVTEMTGALPSTRMKRNNHSSHTKGHGWVDCTNAGLLAPFSKVQRIILHAGSVTELIANSLLMFKSVTTSADYHHEINCDNYERWLK
jgi:hypothetical protein